MPATIKIQVVSSGGIKTLKYTTTGSVLPVTPKKHKLKKGTQVEWICPDGDFGIQFSGATSPFTTGEMSLNAAQGVSTGFRTTNRKKTFKYFVAVAQPGSMPPLIMEDPELEVSDDPGGGKRKRTVKPPKKGPAKKKKK